LVLLTPWTIVTGSMAYNEMPLVAMLAASLIAAAETGLSPWKRGLLAGLLVGAAASVKPTGLLFAGVPAAIVLLGLSRVREWVGIVLSGCAAGLIVLLPWLIRNHEASGNPVFPFAASLFSNELGGTGAWTKEQVARYMGAHRFDGSVAERLRLLVLDEGSAGPRGANAPSTQRGMMHPQWGMLFPMALLSCGLLLVRRGRALLPFPLLLIAASLIAQVVLWLGFTHLQSRFLMPLIAPAAVLVAAAVATIAERASRPLAYVVAAVPLLAQLGFSIATFNQERAPTPGNPNQMLVGGPSLRTGQFFQGASQSEVMEALGRVGPELFVNMALPPNARVYLLGEATPLYFTRPVMYHTTYDTSPLSGLDPAEWNEALREQKVDLVLVDLAEISRLERSGWNSPGVTAETVSAWMHQYAAPVVPPERWGEMGLFLVRPLYEGGGSSAPGTSKEVSPPLRGPTS
jgi:4-amino-4-deoxy-L-arabinose transferase-like glycosyltransferase